MAVAEALILGGLSLASSALGLLGGTTGDDALKLQTKTAKKLKDVEKLAGEKQRQLVKAEGEYQRDLLGLEFKLAEAKQSYSKTTGKPIMSITQQKSTTPFIIFALLGVLIYYGRR